MYKLNFIISMCVLEKPGNKGFCNIDSFTGCTGTCIMDKERLLHKIIQS